jgi:hypothetical protein
VLNILTCFRSESTPTEVCRECQFECLLYIISALFDSILYNSIICKMFGTKSGLSWRNRNSAKLSLRSRQV